MKEWSREIRCLFNLFSPLHTSEISPIKIRELKCSTFFIVSWVGLEHKAVFFLYMLWVISATALLSRCSSVLILSRGCHAYVVPSERDC